MKYRTASPVTVVALAITVIVAESFFLARAHAREDATIVTVDGGKVRGVAAGGLLTFKGIPFARPPIGNLRWRAPQPVEPWKGIRDANVVGADPMQPANLATPGVAISEDCLYLNVWSPDSTATSARLPVMVWIYGGGLVKGGAALYPGQFLAHQGIVVVTFNYRLGRIGFFAHPGPAAEAPDEPRGNYGYMDQIAALKWVQRNIAAFGGDPNQVTVAGESAGGGSVLVLLTSPMARGLFQRAILESPGLPTARAAAAPMRNLDSAESIAVEYARAHGITGDNKTTIAALRALPAEELTRGLDAYGLAVFGGPEIPGLSHSIIDGRLVVEAPEEALRAGRQTMVPVIVGANDRDMAVTPAQTKDALFARLGPRAVEARKLYDPTGNATFDDVRQAVCGDFGMIEPSRILAEWMADAGQRAYFYRFSYVPDAWRAKMAGAVHAGELIFVFDCVPALVGAKTTAADLAMAKMVSAYWVDFIKTGDPNGGGRPEWKPYDPSTRDVMNFTAAGAAFGTDPLKQRLDLWSEVWDPGR
jgi:para-nitrobenzyl esterase